jgi:hypothetical protein
MRKQGNKAKLKERNRNEERQIEKQSDTVNN